MASPKKHVQKLLDKRDQLRAEMDALRHKIEGIEIAIDELDETGLVTDQSIEKRSRAQRGHSKATLLELLQDAGMTGLNAVTAVEMAAKRGIDLDRGTVSSLLSRFKRDGVVDHDGERYRLKSAASLQPAQSVQH